MTTYDFDGKSVIVTGGGQGIGRACAEAFAANGASVVVNDIDAQRCAEVVAAIEQAGGKARACVADITDPARIDELVALACEQYGGLDVMLNNAGGSFPTAMLEIDRDEYRRLMALNFDAVYFGTLAALRVMLPRRAGVILSTTSGAGINAMPGLAVYGAAKAAVIALMKSVAVEHGRQGIRANSISPGAMATPGLLGWLETLPGGAQAYNDAQPQGRLGRPDEIANAALFLASDQASFVNGATLAVDGAVHASLWSAI